ncbi:MAG TPA: hypothetical protein VMU09_11585 [Acidimicrobiales bacterium]|nr:hypothetical protein [Acidimicrobiales bacterium]
MTTTAGSVTETPVAIGKRGGPDKPSLRTDGWWVEPVITVVILISFVVYSTWAAFVGKNYYAGASLHRDLISPFYSPCIANSCVPGSHAFGTLPFWNLSPALLILIFPLGFRLTCYYYRKAYYRSFWWSPPACAVADAHGSYSGETKFPLILQNVHRYFFWILLVFNVILTYDAVIAYRQPGLPSGWGVSLGAIVLTFNAVFLWLYSLSCHACRHFCGGQVRSFAKHPVRHKLWKAVTPLNAIHMRFAWISLFVVALSDLYVRLVASGTITDPGFHF